MKHQSGSSSDASIGTSLNYPPGEFYTYAEDLERIKFNNALLPKDETVLVNFFASWCVPCQVEHPLLAELQQLGIKIYGIAWKDEVADTKTWLQRHGNVYHQVSYDPGAAGVIWGITGIPETFVLADGNIIFHHAGVLTQQIIEDAILPLFE